MGSDKPGANSLAHRLIVGGMGAARGRMPCLAIDAPQIETMPSPFADLTALSVLVMLAFRNPVRHSMALFREKKDCRLSHLEGHLASWPTNPPLTTEMR